MPQNIQDIRDYIRECREADSLGRPVVAAKLGWSTDRLGRIETGAKKSLAAADLALLAEVIPSLNLARALLLLEASAQQALAARAGSSAA